MAANVLNATLTSKCATILEPLKTSMKHSNTVLLVIAQRRTTWQGTRADQQLHDALSDVVSTSIRAYRCNIEHGILAGCFCERTQLS